MKKFLALLLALIMCVGVLASCGNNNNSNDDAAGATLDDAKELLNSMMKDDNGKATPNDYNVVGKLTIGETSFDVTWATDNANVKVVAASKAGFWTIDVPSVNAAEASYKLTATIKAADGSTANVEFTRKLPVIDNAGVETEFKAGVAYTMFMKQANLGYTVYALNTTQKGENKYIETTLDPKAAAVFYVEVVDGGYKIYTEIDGVKNYLHAELKEADGGKVSKYIGFKADSTCVFSYDKELAVFKITLNGGEYGVGTYNSFNTVSLSDATYFKADNINVEGGQFPIGLMTKEHADTLAPSVKPENNDPAADSVLTIAQAIELGNSKSKDQYTENKYYVSGTVKEIQNTTFGNLVITDGTNDILVYGTYDATGANRFDAMDAKPAVGDTITVYGIIGKYNDAQIKNGWVTANAHEHVFENGECACGAADPNFVPTHICADADNDFLCDDATCDKVVEPAADSVLTLEQANALGVLMGSNSTANKYYVVVIVKNVYQTTYGNMYVKDENGVEFTIYGTYSADGTVRYGDMENKPVAGDTIKVYGVITSYNGAAQMKNGWIVEHTVHGDNHNYVDGVCTACGALEPVVGQTVASAVIADVASANGWANSTQYLEFAIDENIKVSATGGSNTGKYYTSGNNWRIYQNESPAVVITAENGKTIKSVKISYASQNTGAITFGGNTIASDTLVEINAATATFGVGNTGTANNGQARITAIEVIYE